MATVDTGWSAADREAWWEAHEQDQPPTIRVRYRPEFVIEACLPPWVDPDEWLAAASMGWNDWLCDPAEHWTEPGGDAIDTRIRNEGSGQFIEWLGSEGEEGTVSTSDG